MYLSSYYQGLFTYTAFKTAKYSIGATAILSYFVSLFRLDNIA